jgi:hypothetical protein
MAEARGLVLGVMTGTGDYFVLRMDDDDGGWMVFGPATLAECEEWLDT